MMEKDAHFQQVLHRLEVHPLPRVLLHPHALSEEMRVSGNAKSDAKASETSVAVPLSEIREQAANEGYQQGLIQGQEEGNRRGREEGFRNGHQEGLAAAEKESLLSVQQAIDTAQATLRKQVAQLAHQLNSIPAQIADCLLRAEDDMVAVAHESVCRILGSSAVSSDGVRRVVREAMAQLRSGEQIVIRLHPGDYRLLTDAASLLPGREVSYIADNQVTLGGCLIDYPQGTLDARLETQMRQFTDLLLRVRQSVSADKAVDEPVGPVADLSVTEASDQRAQPGQEEDAQT